MNISIEERSEGIVPLEVMKLCKDFLGNKWSAVTEDNFDFKVLAQGFGNRLFICGVKEGTADKVEPEKVLVRYYGGNLLPKDMPMRTMTEAGEVLAFYCLNEQGLGPKLYGVFKEGRIEEYIPSTNFTMDQFCNDDQVSDAIARALARFHAADIPIKRRPLDLIKVSRERMGSYLSAKGDLPPPPPPADAVEAEHLAEIQAFDEAYEAELEWIERTMPHVSTRIVYAHHDANRSNMIVRADDGSNKPLDQRIVIVDYEFNGYNHRGVDLANHFMMRVMDFGNPEPFTGRPYPSLAKRSQFIATYLDECKKQPAFASDWDENGSDSVEHVLMEIALYGLADNLMGHAWMSEGHLKGDGPKMGKPKGKGPDGKGPSGKGPGEKGPGPGGPPGFIRAYKERKAEFLERYPQFS